MSAVAHSIKVKMFGFLKNWLSKPIENRPEPQPRFRDATPVRPAPTAQTPKLGRVPSAAPAASLLELPLASVLGQMPAELRSRVRSSASAASISIPMETVLPQLASGAVKVTFGELRQAAPEMFFSGSDRDHVPVPLPLPEVLSRINPALLTRRPVQKRFEVPAEVTGPFGEQGQGLVFSVGPTQAEPAAPKPAVRATTPRPALPVSPVRQTIPQASPMSPSAARPAAQSVRQSVPQPAAIRPVPLHPAAQPVSPSVASNGAALIVSLSDLTGAWPEAVRREIALLNFSKAIAALPMEFIEGGLKHGRVACSWKQLRAWLKPAPAAAVSAHDAAMLDLPLKVIAPLYLAKQQAAKAQKKVAIDENIPNLFFGAPQPAAASAPPLAAPAPPPAPPPPQPADTNYYVWKDNADAPVEPEVVFKRGPASPGTEFLKRYATPNEIVSRAAALDGVAGALISLPDGLLVANQIPPDLNADTLAAFLPQIFGRVSQCTKELRMGDLNNLNFTVGNVPWKIFRIGSIFFAAFGRAGESLPTAQLAGLAAELDRKPR